LHIQSIADVELFGINTANYGNFILDWETWEQRYGFSVGTLRVGPLAAGESYAWSPGDQTSYAQLLDNLENLESALFRANHAGQSVAGVLQRLADCERRGLNDFETSRSAASAFRTAKACIDVISPRGRVPPALGRRKRSATVASLWNSGKPRELLGTTIRLRPK
jgi:hypothetical protein